MVEIRPWCGQTCPVLKLRNWAQTTVSRAAIRQTTVGVSIGASDVAVDGSHDSGMTFRHLTLNIEA
jgi:hypothetical protein